jgi:hypothetical protein
MHSPDVHLKVGLALLMIADTAGAEAMMTTVLRTLILGLHSARNVRIASWDGLDGRGPA